MFIFLPVFAQTAAVRSAPQLRLPRPHPRVPIALAASALFMSPAHAQPVPADGAEVLAPIKVVCRAGTSPYAPEAASAAKTDLPLRELPQSVRVITRQSIDDLGATRLDDVLDHVAGVSRQNNFGGLWDNVAIRGLPGHENSGLATLLNGFAGNRGYSAPRDLASVEAIEFLKGTAAALYGSSEPGGTLNVVSKSPRWNAGQVVDLRAGSHGLARAAFDSTGPLGDRFAYRLNVAAEHRDGFRDFVGNERRIVAPAFTWKLAPGTVLDYRGEYARLATPLDRGTVAIDNRLGGVPRERFLGEPGDGDITLTNERHQLWLSHDWSPTWRSRFGASYLDTSLNGHSTQATGTLGAGGVLRRQSYYRDYDSEDVSLQAELQGVVGTGAIEHELLLGVETFRYRMNSLALAGAPSDARPNAIDVFDPVYGQPRLPLAPNTDTLERQRNTALYAQDAIKLAPDWRLVAGVRFDSYRQSLENRRTGRTVRPEPSATSPRLGLSWMPTPRWTVYANAGRSFRPNNGSDSAGNTFDTEKGRALELGAKWENAAQTLGATAALFDIRKRNVLTSDPANPTFSIAAGEVRSRGLEFDLAGQLTTHWRLTASLLLNDVEITEDNRLAEGEPLRNAPKVTASALALYAGALANGQRFSIGAGVTHIGERLGEAYTRAEQAGGIASFQLPAYTTAKLVGHWQLSPSLRLSLDVDNLFDRTYYTSSYSRLWVMPGTSRAVSLGLQARF